MLDAESCLLISEVIRIILDITRLYTNPPKHDSGLGCLFITSSTLNQMKTEVMQFSVCV